MLFRILVSSLLALTTSVLSKSTRIIGGSDANIIDFPFVVALITVKNGVCECTGSIISNRDVLTTAHCIRKFENPIKGIRLQIGSSDISSATARILNIEHVFVHPLFSLYQEDNVKSFKNDIAILKVQEFIEFNEFVNKIELPTKDVETGDTGHISGWGLISLKPPVISRHLKKLHLGIYSRSDCRKSTLLLLQDDQFCAYYKRGAGACHGDSGTALVHNNTVLGIASTCVPCALGFPDVYTNVFQHLDFIINYMST